MTIGFFKFYRFFKSLPSGKRLHNYGLNHHAINGNIHYFYGQFQ